MADSPPAHYSSTAYTDSTAGSFADALLQALCQLDGQGRLTAKHARRLRRAIIETPKADRLGVAMEIEEHLGPFTSLPRQARDAIVRAIGEDDWWRMAGRNIGNWHFAMTRLTCTAYRKLDQSKFGRLGRPLCEVVRSLAQGGPAYSLYWTYRQQLLWQARSLARPTLGAMLQLAEIEPWHFAVSYAQGIPQPAAFRAFWHDPSRQNTVGVMLGIDLLPTPHGWWFIESNLNGALRLERTALYDRDPFVANLLAFVRAKGYRHLVVMGNTDYVDPLMAKQYEEGAAAAGLKLTIIEDAYLPKKVYGQSFHVPPPDEDSTLVMRIKQYRTSLDNLFHHKRTSRQALEVYQRRSTDPAIHLVPTGFSPILGDVASDTPFPNLVYKYPERDSGSAVVFLKAMSIEHARTVIQEAAQRNHLRSSFERFKQRVQRFDEDGLFQPYVRSSMLPDRRLYIVRAHVLLTPVGTHFLSAHRVVAGREVPAHLPSGLVRDPKPYLVNYSAGAHYEIVPPEEEPTVVKTALAIAHGFAWAAAYGFQTMTD
jgi:hypothetical protein